MNADQIADEVVDVLNAIVDPVYAFTAENPPDGPEWEREGGGAYVSVYPFAERETPFDRGDAVQSERDVNVLIVKTLDDGETRADCLAWVNQLKDALRETSFDGFRWAGNETLVLYDVDVWNQQRTFVSLFRATYRGLA